MRKLATIRRISELRPIPNADAIECAVIDGWNVVVKRGEFQTGDLAVYLEIDSWVPTELAPFLTKPGHAPKEYNGVQGERLRTVKLRGQVSQGLLLPITVMPHSLGFMFATDKTVGEDVSHWLGIQKWEAPVPAQLAGTMRGNFPTQIPKTDQERIQNLVAQLREWQDDQFMWEMTEKLDGSSMTVYNLEGNLGVCSRNLDLIEDAANSFWAAAIENQIHERMTRAGLTNHAIQGELIGEGIQGNPYKIVGRRFYVFDIYSVAEARYLSPVERQRLAGEMGLLHVPVLDNARCLKGETVGTLLAAAEGKSVLNGSTEREGLVFKCHGFDVSFKAISNKFLLRGGE